MRPEVKAAIAVAIEAYLKEEEKAAPSTLSRQRPETSQWRLFGRGETVSGRARWQSNRTRK